MGWGKPFSVCCSSCGGSWIATAFIASCTCRHVYLVLISICPAEPRNKHILHSGPYNYTLHTRAFNQSNLHPCIQTHNANLCSGNFRTGGTGGAGDAGAAGCKTRGDGRACDKLMVKTGRGLLRRLCISRNDRQSRRIFDESKANK